MENSKYIKRLRIFAIFEGISYISFAITMPLKSIYGIELPNKIVGYAHGALFIGYVILVLAVYGEKKMNFITTFWVGLASIIPFGTFIADKKIFKKIQ